MRKVRLTSWVGAMFLVLGFYASAAPLPLLRIENVCITKLPGYTYDVSHVVDFKLVHVLKDSKEAFLIYVGFQPQLKGSNIKYGGRELLISLRNRIIRLAPPQDGEILGIPSDLDQRLFHIVVHPTQPDYQTIVTSVVFCP